MIHGPERAAALRGKLCAALAFTLWTAVPAEAQRAREEAQLGAERQALEQRGREVLHTGEPLKLVGVGVGDPDVLARTPALATATLGLVKVDRGELRARKLAMYEGAARFDGALRAHEDEAPAPLGEDPRRVVHPAAQDTPGGSDPTASTWPWVAAAVVTALGLVARAMVARERRGEAQRPR